MGGYYSENQNQYECEYQDGTGRICDENGNCLSIDDSGKSSGSDGESNQQSDRVADSCENCESQCSKNKGLKKMSYVADCLSGKFLNETAFETLIYLQLQFTAIQHYYASTRSDSPKRPIIYRLETW